MRRHLAVLLAGVLLGLSVPALADHITEPTAPITGLALRLYQYPFQRTTLLRCDGSDVVDFEVMRIEADVTAEAAPSEHYRVRLVVYKVDQFGNPKEDWSVLWQHQNIPPHFRGAFETLQSAQYKLLQHRGFWQALVVVTGQESGREFTESCTFRRA